MKKARPGRPPKKDSTSSFTVSLRLSEKKQLEKKYETLTKAIKTLLNEELQQN